MSEDLTAEIIFEYDNHQNIPWNIVEYKPVPEYLGKSISYMSNRHVTKKGCYMDDHIKNVKHLQSPDKYPAKSDFDQTQNKKHSHKTKINPRLKKNSYLDQIQLEGKKLKIGVGSYNLQKTQKQIREHVNKMAKYTKTGRSQRTTFYETTQVQSNQIPGAGSHNPHLDVPHLKLDRMTPQVWRKKHATQHKQYIKKKKKQTAPNSYRPVSAGTFDRLKLDTERKKKICGKSLNKSFGTDAKFIYCRPTKKKIIEMRPDPTRYSLSIQWNGKKDPIKKRGWSSFLSTKSNGFSVYNSK